jgi:cobalt transporter subunit CbtA
MVVALVSGALAGLLSFVVQHFVLLPLIDTAETYEAAARQSMPGAGHEDEDWQPTNRTQRTLFTALGTVLSGIGFAAVLFGAAALAGRPVDVRQGVLWGLGGFVCFAFAPSLGLPPEPPGAAVADLFARQLWWTGTAFASAAGLWLLIGRGRRWLLRVGGAALLLSPHLIGAPGTSEPSVVPSQLMHQFAVASLATSGLFWLALGAIGGFLYARSGIPSATGTAR